MPYPISCFFMDVRASSEISDVPVMEAYLGNIASEVEQWARGICHVRVKHRRGDEIVFVGEGFETSYLFAHFIHCLWRFREHPPYFGISFGGSDVPAEAIEDIETWMHPMFKKAREAQNGLRQRKPDERPALRFQSDACDRYLVRNLNQWAEMDADWNRLQSESQRQAVSLFHILRTQGEVAEFLGKTQPNVSLLLKRGHSRQSVLISRHLEESLRHCQTMAGFGQTAAIRELLRDAVRDTLRETVHDGRMD